MAFDFPNSPTDGQVFTPSGGPTYTYNAAGTKWLVSPIASTVTITSGFYTPTLTPTTNIDASTAYGGARYIRIGNVVVVAGRADVDTTAAGNTFTELGISLPVASDLTVANGECAGVYNLVGTSAIIYGDATNNRALAAWSSTTTSNSAGAFIFMYAVQ